MSPTRCLRHHCMSLLNRSVHSLSASRDITLCRSVHRLAASTRGITILQRTVYSPAAARDVTHQIMLIQRCSFSRTRSHYHDVGKIADDLYANPITELQPYIAVPIIPDSQQVFNPPKSKQQEAEELFKPTRNYKIEFNKSLVDLTQLPSLAFPEVSFIGRSNVGKSSLIRALFMHIPDIIVKTSKTPGFTRTLQFFNVGNRFSLVDMPGYGYRMPEYFVDMVEEYLKTRRKLCRTFLLLDSEAGIDKYDRIGIKMLEEFRIPYVIVMTKIDTAPKGKLLRNLMSVMEHRDKHAQCCFPQPFLLSAKTGAGVPLLQAFIGYVTGNLEIEQS